MNILFVCRYNRFRSRTAEAYFKKINKNKKIKVKSAGIFKGNYPLSPIQVKTGKKLGIDINGRPQAVSSKLLAWQDLIIVITNDYPKGLFNYGQYKSKVIIWKIKDVLTGKNEEANLKIMKEIMERVDKLNIELNEKLK